LVISARPYPNIKELFSHGDRFGEDTLSFYPLGRDALLYSLMALELKEGDSVIIPAYMCDSTIKPLKDFGFNLVFIDIEKNLSLSIDKLKKVIKGNQIKALLVVHYFGLTQNFDKVIDTCREFDVKVIEDASHSVLSQFLRDRSDIKGDMEIFSMRKSLPIVDGGALRINSSDCNLTEDSDSLCVSMLGDIKYLILRMLERAATGLGINIYGKFIDSIKNRLRDKSNIKECELNIETCQASWQLRRYLTNEEYLLSVQRKVVGNFNQLSQALQGIGYDLLVESIEDGVVPQACIVYDNRGGLVNYLRSSGVGAWQWPGDEMPKEVTEGFRRYPNSFFLNKRLVLLPVHQSMGEKQVDYMIKILSRWKL